MTEQEQYERRNEFIDERHKHSWYYDCQLGGYKIIFLTRLHADQFDYEESKMAYIIDKDNVPYKVASFYATNEPSKKQGQDEASRIKNSQIAQSTFNKALEILTYLDYNDHKHFKTRDYNEVKESFQHALETDSLQDFDFEKLANPKALARSNKALMTIQAQDEELSKMKFEYNTPVKNEIPECLAQ